MSVVTGRGMSRVLRWGASLVALAAFPGLFACKARPSAVAQGPSDGAEAVVAEEPREAVLAGDSSTSVRIAALATPTTVCSAPEWPPHDPSKAADERLGVIRLGYLRKGQIVTAKPSLIKKPNCVEGWYELTVGGYVCGKFVTMDLSAKELEDAPHAPNMDAPLPYDYGLNLTNGAPAYRKLPSRKERDRYEDKLAVGKNAKMDPPPAASGDDGEDTPWYLKAHSGRPNVSIDDLKDSEGPVAERMVRGFYVSLDEEIKRFSGTYWRTTHSLLIPSEFLLVHKGSTEFEGVDMRDAAETRRLPLGWILAFHGKRYTIDENEKVHRHEHLDRFTIAALTGKKKTIDNREYYETTDGGWMRDLDGTTTAPGPPPPGLLPGEKWIDVSLSTQTLVAFEGDKPVFATIISSGKHDDEDKTKDHRTKMGSFRIREKHVAATMDADSSTDGPYSIQDVPWIMYFDGSYALHGAFWHVGFGHERSHGCINMMPHDARVLFGWVGPTLPEGWHGVRATGDNPGTRVVVHD